MAYSGMTLQGKFLLNTADIAPQTIYGVDTFIAFSGQQAYINKGACGHIPKPGPVPPDNDYIVDRPVGNLKTRVKAAAIDAYKTVTTGTLINHYEWFGLYRDDGAIDDTIFIRGIERGGFRLRGAILNTPQFDIPNSTFKAYGKTEVTGHGSICP